MSSNVSDRSEDKLIALISQTFYKTFKSFKPRLAGAPPVEAVKYQILIMFLIAAGTGLGTLAAVTIGSKRLFDERQRLCLDRLRHP